ARRRAAARVLSGRAGDAPVRSRQALVVAPTLEDGPRLEAPRTARALCGQSALVQSLRAARRTRPPVDLQDPRRRCELSLGMARGAAVAAPPRNGETGWHIGHALDGIAAFCDHAVGFGVVESLNTTIFPLSVCIRAHQWLESGVMKRLWPVLISMLALDTRTKPPYPFSEASTPDRHAPPT